MHITFLYSLLLTTSVLSFMVKTEYLNGEYDVIQFGLSQKVTPQDYNGLWGEGITCPYNNPPFPDGTTVYGGSVPAAMTTDAVNYLHDGNVKMFQVSETRTYSNLMNLYFVMRKEFHTWHYSGGKLLKGCWKGVTVYQLINHS